MIGQDVEFRNVVKQHKVERDIQITNEKKQLINRKTKFINFIFWSIGLFTFCGWVYEQLKTMFPNV
jgi:hypothetical protein